MEGAKLVSAKGQIVGTDVEGPFNGAVELSSKLAGSKDVAACMVKHWFRFGNGRDLAPEDQCTIDTLNAGFKTSGGNIRELLLTLVQTDAFMYRTKGVSP
jgi:hypothetical protein